MYATLVTPQLSVIVIILCVISDSSEQIKYCFFRLMNIGGDYAIYNGSIYNFVKKKYLVQEHIKFVVFKMDFMSLCYLNKVGFHGLMNTMLRQMNINIFLVFLVGYLRMNYNKKIVCCFIYLYLRVCVYNFSLHNTLKCNFTKH
uniref:SJCHGC05109 protein n=1 Tax=Schistosoma japonicum TaxID=6182 RepID=Q5DHZ8_SCHJA|nr:SJCHGC05109 protein [Schistosoma japonicum]